MLPPRLDSIQFSTTPTMSKRLYCKRDRLGVTDRFFYLPFATTLQPRVQSGSDPDPRLGTMVLTSCASWFTSCDMAASSDRTLLTSMGFQDDDRAEPTHDAACRYLAIPENAMRLSVASLQRVLGVRFPERPSESAMRDGNVSDSWYSWRNIQAKMTSGLQCQPDSFQAELERKLIKGRNQYRAVVGFLDVSIDATVPCDDAQPALLSTSVEVKWGRISSGAVLRQIGLYREFLHESFGRSAVFSTWVLATPWPLTKDYADALRAEDIRHVLLAEKFQAWIREQNASVDDESEQF